MAEEITIPTNPETATTRDGVLEKIKDENIDSAVFNAEMHALTQQGRDVIEGHKKIDQVAAKAAQ